MSINLIHLVRDLGVVWIIWLVIGGAFHTWGNLIFKKLRLSFLGVKAFFTKIWLGFIISILFFSIVHLFFPVNCISSFLFYIPASVIFWKNNLKLTSLYVKTLDKRILFALILLIGLLSLYAMPECRRADSCMYHLNTIRWINEYSIVPGLGNLHTRLGFNQSYFLYCASIRFFPYLQDYGKNISTIFIWILLCSELILCRKGIDCVLLAFLHFLPFSFYWFSSPNPDIASVVLQILMFKYMVSTGENLKDKDKSNKYYSNIFMAALIGITSITIKLSNAYLVIGFGIVSFVFANKNNMSLLCKQQLKKIIVLSSLLLFVWAIRGYIQTGYPFFPLTIGGIEADWTVAKEAAKIAEKSVYTFSRIYEYDFDSKLLENYSWLPRWFSVYVTPDFLEQPEIMNKKLMALFTFLIYVFNPNIYEKYGYCLLICLFFSTLIALVWLIKVIKQKSLSDSKWILSLFVAIICSLIAWFFTAPDPRFSNALYVLLLCSSVLLLEQVFPGLTLTNRYKNLIILVPFFAYFISYSVVCIKGVFKLDGIRVSVAEELPYKITDSGLKVTLIYEQKWPFDTYLISNYATEFNSKLRLRGKSYQEGFTVK